MKDKELDQLDIFQEDLGWENYSHLFVYQTFAQQKKI